MPRPRARPLNLLGTFVKTESRASGLSIMLDIVLRGQELSAVLPEVGVLLGFAAVFFGVGV